MRLFFTGATTVTTAFLFTLLLAEPPSQLPSQIELSCPAGSQVVQPVGQTYNSSTGKYRQWLCVDSFGNIVQSTGAGSPGGSNTQFQYNNNGILSGTNGITFTGIGQIQMSNGQIGDIVGGQKVTFSGTDLTIQSYGGTNIKITNPITLPTTTFASLGAVPAAGVGSKYCTDCTTATTCAGTGSGHLAISNGANWTCQ